ncbi:DUF3857 domain-containing protein [Cochleicola gelatinilyticus]|uniref:DUF3857 domain-containing protein n=1 Tax=Cochleicola gelatinilyticus TaxID=1763537 RepID=A0A167EZF3_9FLAO|nr:DUF3857 domain-containing protein [Cochleicola gelatinilyticus]OAB76038.1 hypothetical protein ULVI_13320 [Cochleicola gelatinilyticus]
MTKALMLLLFIGTQILFAQTSYTIADIPKELRENANSVVIHEKKVIDISRNGKSNSKINRTIAVFNKLGDNDVNAYAHYDDDTKVRDVEAFIYDANGNELKHIKQRDFKDVSAVSGFSLYEDNRELHLEYTPTVYPYIVRFISEVEGNSTVLPTWYPINSYVSSTIHNELTITYASDNKPNYKKEHVEGYDISISETPGQITCVAKNLKAIRYEEEAPPYFNVLPKVYFTQDSFYLKGMEGQGKDWNSFGSWMQQSLLYGTTELSPATIALAKQLVKNETTNEGKARKIYEYLQNKVRYISVQIGIGGWKPMLASEVDRLSYGDCKALTNYTKALLEAVGVPSYYTILYLDEDERDITKDVPTIQGNHAFLGVPNNDEMIWLECTSQRSPFGYVSNSHDDRDVLIITPNGGEIVHTKKYSVEENTQVTKGTIHLNAEGAIKADLERTSKGLQYGNRHGLTDLTVKKQKEYYKNRWGHINGFTIPSLTLNDDKTDIVFTENVHIQAPRYASRIGKDFLFCVNVFNQSDYIPPRNINRKQSLYLKMNFKDTDTLEIVIPSGYKLEALPENKKIENEFGSYLVSFEKISENKLKYTREFILKKGEYLPSKYSQYRDFRKNIYKLDQTKILINRIEP